MTFVGTTLDVVLPVLNEELTLLDAVATLRDFMSSRLSEYHWRIIVADNGSTDGTRDIGTRLAEELSEVRYTHLVERGRGRALRETWLASRSDIVGYMDVDLSSDLRVFPELVAAVSSGDYDVAIGSRLMGGSRVMGRSASREIFARSYSLLFRTMFLARFRDAQCGFKALSRRAADELLPLVRDNGWFFDTELLLLAENAGYRIKELPVSWTDDPDSRVRVIPTAVENVKGLLRLRFGGLRDVVAPLDAQGDQDTDN